MNSTRRSSRRFRLSSFPGGRRGLSPAWALLLVFTAPAALQAAEATPPSLAVSLAKADDHAGAALEFRRQALDSQDSASKAAFYWSAAREYHEAGQYEVADKMVDAAENEDPDLLAPTLLLRGENSAAIRDWPSSAFFFRNLLSTPGDTNRTRYAARSLAVAELRRRQPDAARQALLGTGSDESTPLSALDRYSQGRDKRPWLGGLLGMIPGLGYAYAGEFANAGRSLILNSLFIFGMVNTADNENWGA